MKLQELFEAPRANSGQISRIRYAEQLINKLEDKLGKSFEKEVTDVYKAFLGGPQHDKGMEDRIAELSSDRARQLGDAITALADKLAGRHGMRFRHGRRGRVWVEEVPNKK